ncbi:MAG: cysteine desulfurase family protein [Candidatus Magasanikbacteria bacterium]
MNPKKEVYLDYAATSPVADEVLGAMEPYFSVHFGNPSSIYSRGLEARTAVGESRKTIASFLGTTADTIFFMSGGTESINTAIFGAARKHKEYGNHIITTAIEHKAVLNSLKALEKEGFEVTYLPVDKHGLVTAQQIMGAITNKTLLISIMYANNEIGSIEPIADIGKEILKFKKHNESIYPLFHTDACQATNYLDMHVEKLHADLLSFNGSKMNGPKGCGVLYMRRGVKIEQMIYGGSQEFGFRAGTEDVPSIVGMAKAVELIMQNGEKNANKVRKLRDYFWEETQRAVPKIMLNGPALEDTDKRLPNNLHISILDIEGEALLLYLDEKGIMCSTGSACNSSSLEPSHVLTECGLPYEYAHGTLRFTLGASTTKEEIDYVIDHLPGVVEKLRKMSPVNLEIDHTDNTHAQYHQK